MTSNAFKLLERIHSPADLRQLPESRLLTLAHELRAYLLQSVSSVGGHFAAGLGAIEITVALHYVFDTPHDRLVWDVGHQSYPHKILTGRRDQICTIKQQGGLAPFPTRTESEYDTFGVGHSSTSISAALGMAVAAAAKHEQRNAIAVIGDGAMTAGLAYEALNNLGDLGADVLVVLNDNEMSISPNVGALNKRLTRLLSGNVYASMREGGKELLKQVPPIEEFVRRSKDHVKSIVAPGTLFEELGVNYFGPVDGHDLLGLVKILQNLKRRKGPRLLHIVTRKGKGYAPAEQDPVGYHAVPKFDPEVGVIKSGKPGKPDYTKVFGNWLCDMAAADQRLMAITPAMREGSGLVRFEKEYPGRYIDVGIAEQHSVTLAAGMACEGLKPVVAIYSTFLQRAYDQLIHDVAVQNLPVLFAIDRAGVVGPDGPTHAGSFDLTYLRCIPNMTVMAPADENECRQMLYTGFQLDGPAAVRYPRGKGPGTDIAEEMTALPVGKGVTVRQGRSTAILAFGSPLADALQVAETLDATVVNMRFVKPIDEQLLVDTARQHDTLITVEDNAVMGGAGSAVNECLLRHDLHIPTLNLGLPDRFIDHGSREQLLEDAELHADGILASINTFLERLDCAARRPRVVS